MQRRLLIVGRGCFGLLLVTYLIAGTWSLFSDMARAWLSSDGNVVGRAAAVMRSVDSLFYLILLMILAGYLLYKTPLRVWFSADDQ
jgi:hypothetical protein